MPSGFMESPCVYDLVDGYYARSTNFYSAFGLEIP